jgi:predicted TPR repeat methyltransferase
VKAAVSGYRQVLLRVPALTTAYLRIAALLEGQGDTAGALDTYRELAKLEPGNSQTAAAIARLSSQRH